VADTIILCTVHPPKTQNPKMVDDEPAFTTKSKKPWIFRKLDNGLQYILREYSEPKIKGDF